MKADWFKEFPNADYMKIGFEQGFDAVVEHWRSLSGNTAWSSVDPSGAQVCENCIVNDNLLMLMQFVPFK